MNAYFRRSGSGRRAAASKSFDQSSSGSNFTPMLPHSTPPRDVQPVLDLVQELGFAIQGGADLQPVDGERRYQVGGSFAEVHRILFRREQRAGAFQLDGACHVAELARAVGVVVAVLELFYRLDA